MLPKRVEIARVASVSNRVITRNLEQEQKKNGGRGRGRGEEETPPPPLSFLFFFLLSSQLSRLTRAETLATQARVEKPCCIFYQPRSNLSATNQVVTSGVNTDF